MWKACSSKDVLRFNCAPEMVLYDKASRSTSLLTESSVSVYQIFAHQPDCSFDIDDIMTKLANVNTSTDDIFLILENLCIASLIERVQ